MSTLPRSGQAPFSFAYRSDLHRLPGGTVEAEINLHGGFAQDPRPETGHLFYGMPDCGLVRIDADLQRQELISLPDNLRALNFHSTKIANFGGNWRLAMPAESAELVAVITLEGRLDFMLSRPEFEEYASAEVPYKPTDTVLVGDRLYVADGYGANYISSAVVSHRRWMSIFGGKTEDRHEHGKFATAHGISLSPDGDSLVIADRPSSRLQAHGFDGQFRASYPLPAGAWPCGVNYAEYDGRRYAVVGCLQDPVEGRPAPIYILDGDTYEVLSTIRPKEELGVEAAQHLHNVVWHSVRGELYLVCQSWRPGHYFVLQKT